MGPALLAAALDTPPLTAPALPPNTVNPPLGLRRAGGEDLLLKGAS